MRFTIFNELGTRLILGAEDVIQKGIPGSAEEKHTVLADEFSSFQTPMMGMNRAKVFYFCATIISRMIEEAFDDFSWPPNEKAD